MQWLLAHVAQVISVLTGLGLVSAIANFDRLLRALVSIGSIFRKGWWWLRGQHTGGDTPSTSPAHQTQQIENEQTSVINSQQVAGNQNVIAGKMNRSPTIYGDVTNVFLTLAKQQRRAKRQTQERRSLRLPKQSKRKPASVASPVADLQADDTEFVTLPVDGSILTPQDAPPQTEDKGDSIVAPPLAVTDGDAEPPNDATSVADDSALTEAEPAEQERLGIEDQQASADAQAPTSDEGAGIEADDAPGTDLSSETGPVDSSRRVDERQTSSAEAISDADCPTSDEAAGAHHEMLAQGDVEEVAEPTRHQDSLPGSSATERLDQDGQRHANAGGAASIPEAIPMTQLTAPADERESAPTLSAGQGLETEPSVPSSTQTRPVEADHVDRDIGDIADEWPAAVVGAALQRLRHARGILPTDLSYDPGWIIAFEAGRWHTCQTERLRYVRGMRAYLRALGVTPTELRELLSLWTAHE